MRSSLFPAHNVGIMSTACAHCGSFAVQNECTTLCRPRAKDDG